MTTTYYLITQSNITRRCLCYGVHQLLLGAFSLKSNGPFGKNTQCKSCKSAKMRKHRAQYPDETRKIKRRYYINNTTKVKADARNWRKSNPNKVTEQTQRKRARKANAPSGKLPSKKELLERQGGRCYWCGCKASRIPRHPNGYKWTLDHVVALANGGSNTEDNIVIACHQCNSRKRDKSLEQWAQENGRLL